MASMVLMAGAAWGNATIALGLLAWFGAVGALAVPVVRWAAARQAAGQLVGSR